MTTSKYSFYLAALIAWAAGVVNGAQSGTGYTFNLHVNMLYLIPIAIKSSKTTLAEIEQAVERATGIPRDEQELELTANVSWHGLERQGI